MPSGRMLENAKRISIKSINPKSLENPKEKIKAKAKGKKERIASSYTAPVIVRLHSVDGNMAPW